MVSKKQLILYETVKKKKNTRATFFKESFRSGGHITRLHTCRIEKRFSVFCSSSDALSNHVSLTQKVKKQFSPFWWLSIKSLLFHFNGHKNHPLILKQWMIALNRIMATQSLLSRLCASPLGHYFPDGLELWGIILFIYVTRSYNQRNSENMFWQKLNHLSLSPVWYLLMVSLFLQQEI